MTAKVTRPSYGNMIALRLLLNGQLFPKVSKISEQGQDNNVY